MHRSIRKVLLLLKFLNSSKPFTMNSKSCWLRIAGTIFGIVAIIHLLRIVTGVPVLIGGWLLPLWVNWLGLGVTGFLCLWLWMMSIKVSE
jgi:hypothetical protein